MSSINLKALDYMPEGAEEGLFTIKYSYFSIDVSTVIYKDSVYIPLLDLLNMLKVYYDVSDKNEVKGFVFNKDSSFSINTKDLSILDISQKYANIYAEEFVKTELEIYVLPSVIERIFHINVIVKPKQLKIYIISDYKFPLILEDERSNKYNNFSFNENADNPELPLLYGRDWNFIDGGMLDYYLTGSQSNSRQNYGLGANLGFQLLGGEVQYNINTNYDNQSRNITRNDNYRWRYSFTENNIISQIALGSINNSQSRGNSIINSNLSSRNLLGIQISNESIKMPTAFTTFIIEDKIEPDWQVELYVADKLYSQTRSDNLGYYRFDLPIKYGNTNTEIRIYGPHGEFVSKKDIISVPSEILVPGEIKYNIGAGQEILNKKYFGSANVSVGITNWLTNSVSFEKEYLAKGYSIIDNSSIRLLNSVLLNTSISPDNFYKAGIRVFFDNMGAYDFVYSYNNQGQYNTKASRSYDISGGFPRLFNLPVNISFRANRLETDNAATNGGNLSLAFNLQKFYISTRYGITNNYDKINSENRFNQNLFYQIDYSWYDKPSFLSFMGNTRLSVNSSYIFETKKIPSIGFAISQEIARLINFNISSQYIVESKMFSLNLSAMVNTSIFRMNSSMQSAQGSDNSYSENISGSLRFDSNKGKLFLSNSGGFSSSSSGGASIRFYIDRNSNAVFDESDEEIEDGSVYVPGATIERDQKGLKRVLNLLPGGRYNLYVKNNSFKNPNILPKVSQFAFIADPNSIKNIDIPCYMSGMAEGTVYRFDSKNNKEGQSGVKIHIVSKNNIDDKKIVPVFSDGTFYANKLIPDKYVAYVDSVQLNLLNCQSEPKFLEFDVSISTEGDYISNLDFLLKSNTTNDTHETIAGEVLKNSISETNITPNIVEQPLITEQLPANTIINPNTNKPIELANSQASELTNPDNLKAIRYSGSKVTYLSPGSKSYLNIIAAYMIANPKIKLYIEGHTDVFGSTEEHQKVSETRANEVRTYLASKGVDKNRLLSNGKGSLYPIAENKNEAGRQKNRRVELKFKDK